MFQDQASTNPSNNSNANDTIAILQKKLTHLFFHQHQKYPGPKPQPGTLGYIPNPTPLESVFMKNDVISFTGSIVVGANDDDTYTSLEMHPTILNIGLHPDPNMFSDSNTTTYQITSFIPSDSSPTFPYSPPKGYVPTIITGGSLNMSGTLNFCVEHFNISAKNSTPSPFEKVKEINFVTPRINLWSLNIGEDPKLFSLVYDAILRNKNITHITFNKNNMEKLEKLDAPNYAKLLQLLVERENLAFNLAESDPTPPLIVPPTITEINTNMSKKSLATIFSGSGSLTLIGTGTLTLMGMNTFTSSLTGMNTLGGGGGTIIPNNYSGRTIILNDLNFSSNSASGSANGILGGNAAGSWGGVFVLSSGGNPDLGAGGPQDPKTVLISLSIADNTKIWFTQPKVDFSSFNLGGDPKFLSLVSETIATDKMAESIDFRHTNLKNAQAQQLQTLLHALEASNTVKEYDISDNNFPLTFSNLSKAKNFGTPISLSQTNSSLPTNRGFTFTPRQQT